MKNGVYLLLGSNLGDRQENLSIARNFVKNICSIMATSSIYQTQAWGNTEQPDFLNQVIQISFRKSPQQLLTEILAIENNMGRSRTEKWGARNIDIDILFFGRAVIHETNLVIPHPGIPLRRFTLLPLAEIAPGFIHPLLHENCAQLLGKCPDHSAVDLFES